MCEEWKSPPNGPSGYLCGNEGSESAHNSLNVAYLWYECERNMKELGSLNDFYQLWYLCMADWACCRYSMNEATFMIYLTELFLIVFLQYILAIQLPQNMLRFPSQLQVSLANLGQSFTSNSCGNGSRCQSNMPVRQSIYLYPSYSVRTPQVPLHYINRIEVV